MKQRIFHYIKNINKDNLIMVLWVSLFILTFIIIVLGIFMNCLDDFVIQSIMHLYVAAAIISFIIEPKKSLKFIKELYFPDNNEEL